MRATDAAAQPPASTRPTAGPIAEASSRTRSADATRRRQTGDGDVDRLDVEPLEHAHEAGPVAVDIDHPDLEVAPPGQRTAEALGPPDHRDAGVVGEGVGELVDGGVGGDLVVAAPHLVGRVGGEQRAAAEPPDGPVGRVAVDEAAAGRDQRDRVVGEAGQGGGRLAHHLVGRRARGPSYVPQALDRVHDPTLPTPGVTSRA